MNETQHLDDWTLEQMAEGMLSEMELPGAIAHVESCGRCEAELEGYRALHAALSGLPRLAPSPAFSDAVMARVRIPAPSPVWAAIQRWLPSTRRGWALVSAAIVAPALPLVWLVSWILTQPGVSAAGMWQQATAGAQSVGTDVVAQVFEWGLDSGVFGAARSVVEALQTVPLETLGGVFGALAIAIPLSAWSLFRLVRTPMRNASYAS